jgi:hypothetical protein
MFSVSNISIWPKSVSVKTFEHERPIPIEKSFTFFNDYFIFISPNGSNI